jgi:alcohol dehydrogenase class IV
VVAAAGCVVDALIHNIEAYISLNATMHTDSLAYERIKLVSKSIRTAVYDGTNMWVRISAPTDHPYRPQQITYRR